MIPDSFIEELKYKSNIEDTVSSYVPLKKQGRNLSGLCPFHSEKTPSFTVFPDTQSYYCFGCGNGGDVITFIRQIENLEYVDALHFLAERHGMTVPESNKEDQSASQLRKRIFEINRESGRFFHQVYQSPEGAKARAYLIERGLTNKTIRTFGIGYAPESWNALRDHLQQKGYSQQELLAAAVVTQGKNGSVYDNFRDRIMFPIIDLRGNVIGFGGRLLGERGPKYLNSPDTPVFKKSRHLFALNFAKNTGQDTLLLGEGYMDVVAMHQAGFTNSVATLGTSLTAEQSRLLSQYAKNVVIAYDSDNAGQTATKRAINLFSETNIAVSVLQLQGAKDPDEYIKKFGAQRFASLVENGTSAMDFEINKLRQKYDLSYNPDKVTFLSDFCRLMAEVHNPLQRDVYIGEISHEIGVSRESIQSTVDGIRKKKISSQSRQNSRELATSISKQTGTIPQSYRKNIEGVVAEEQLITMLLRHPDFYKTVASDLSAEDFSDEGYRQIYRILSQRLRENLPVELIHFSGELSNSLMAKLTQLMMKGQDLTFYPSQAQEYVHAIKQQHNQKDPQQVAKMSPEEYADYLNSLTAEKL